MSTEPKRPRLTARDKSKIQRLYMRGMPPRDICIELRSLALTPRAVTNLAHRCGWGKQREEIAEAKANSAAEILQRAKRDAAEELETILRDVATGMKMDASQLKDSWHLVETASDVSSLMRAKTLFMNQLLKFHGLDQQEAQVGGRASLAFVYARFPDADQPGEKQAEPVDVPANAPAAIEPPDCAAATDSINLDFDDDDFDSEHQD